MKNIQDIKNIKNIDSTEIQIAQEIQSFITTIDNWESETYWTNGIKSILYKVGKKNNFLVAASGIEQKDCGEWLYDLVWYTYGQGFLEDVHLIVESEWCKNIEAIQEDFEKLLVGKARHRLMIFQTNILQTIEKYIDELNSIVDKSNLSIFGDRFLYAVYNKEDQTFYFDLKLK